MATAKAIIKVLLVDDDEEDFIITKEKFKKIKRTQFSLDWAKDYGTALELIKAKIHDVYLIDYALGADNGLELLKEAKKNNISSPFIILTGQKNHNIDMQALELGAYDYLVKDNLDPNNLERSIRYSLEKKRLEKKLQDKNELLQLIYDTCPIGICLLTENCDIIQTNKTFLDMFDFISEDIEGKKLYELMNYKKFKNDIYEQENVVECELYCQPGIKCNLCAYNECFQLEAQFTSISGKKFDALVSSGGIIYKNGKIKTVKLVTFIEITKQKNAEKLLCQMVKKSQEVIERYGIENKNPNVMLDLIDMEMSKIETNNKRAALL